MDMYNKIKKYRIIILDSNCGDDVIANIEKCMIPIFVIWSITRKLLLFKIDYDRFCYIYIFYKKMLSFISYILNLNC